MEYISISPQHSLKSYIIRQPTNPTGLIAQAWGMSVDAAFKLFITPEMI